MNIEKNTISTGKIFACGAALFRKNWITLLFFTLISSLLYGILFGFLTAILQAIRGELLIYIQTAWNILMLAILFLILLEKNAGRPLSGVPAKTVKRLPGILIFMVPALAAAMVNMFFTESLNLSSFEPMNLLNYPKEIILALTGLFLFLWSITLYNTTFIGYLAGESPAGALKKAGSRIFHALIPALIIAFLTQACESAVSLGNVILIRTLSLDYAIADISIIISIVNVIISFLFKIFPCLFLSFYLGHKNSKVEEDVGGSGYKIVNEPHPWDKEYM